MSKPTRTSYSALTKFEECPLKYHLSYIQDINYPSGAAANRGTRLHIGCERFLKGEIPVTALTVDFMKIRPLLEDAKLKSAKAEEVWLLRDDTWEIQDEETPETVFKAVVDIHWIEGNILHIRDLKTGRPSSDHYDQLEAYAILGMIRYPDVVEAVVGPLYLEGLGRLETYPRSLLPHLQDRWKERWDKLFNAEVFPATPGTSNCKWCPYKKSKGGECEWDF